jgi:predicted short-subunit dehydrogenase-like oxidoreductase (DUF2520 family)
MTNSLLLVGGGRLARHLAHYLELEGLAFDAWDRRCPIPFEAARDRAERIALLISDDAIEPFLERYHDGDGRIWIHCSGSLSTPLAEPAHPLMTFGHDLYEAPSYRETTFVTERGRASFDDLFPELPNPHVAIDRVDRPLYHALCVLAGNGSTLLWRKAFSEFHRMGIPDTALLAYLEAIAGNLATSGDPLTGPMARGDERTIRRNLEALDGDPYREVYRTLADAHRETP